MIFKLNKIKRNRNTSSRYQSVRDNECLNHEKSTVYFEKTNHDFAFSTRDCGLRNSHVYTEKREPEREYMVRYVFGTICTI